MITEEEKQEIINAAVEKTLLLIPETMGNLMKEHATMLSMKKDFFDEHKDLIGFDHVLAKVTEKLEHDNPGKDYKSLLNQAAGIAREQIKQTKHLDMETVSSHPDRVFKPLVINEAVRPKLHGEI